MDKQSKAGWYVAAGAALVLGGACLWLAYKNGYLRSSGATTNNGGTGTSGSGS